MVLSVAFRTMLLAVFLAEECFGQPPGPYFRQLEGEFEPQKLLDQFLPGDSEEVEKQLAGITISEEEEQEYGNQGASAYLNWLKRQRLQVIDSGRDVTYLEQLAADLRPNMKQAERYQNIRIYIVRSDVVDARCFPGGSLFFFRGILDFCDSEAGVAGVVAHELSHLDRGHLLTSLKQAKLLGDRRSQMGNDPAAALAFGATLLRVWSRPFRPEDERKADRDAVDWLYASGYDPRELAKFFLQYLEEHRQRAQIKQLMPSFLQSHPLEQDRANAVLERFAELDKESHDQSLYVGRVNLKRRIPRSQQAFAE